MTTPNSTDSNTDASDFAAGFADDTAPATGTPAADEHATDEHAAPHDATPGEQIDYKALYETTEARFRTLKGKYDAEVPRLTAENRELKARPVPKVEPAAAPAPVVEQPADTHPDDDDDLPEEVRAALDDMPTVTKAVDALIKHRTRKLMAPVQAQLAPLAKQSEQQAAEAHFGYIAAAHKDWNEVVNGDKFKAWVAGMPNYRRGGAEQVLEAGSAEDVVSLIGDFKKESGFTQPAVEDDDDIAVPGSRAGGPRASAVPDGDKDDFSAGFNMK
jgi:hypothetical protein